MAENRSMHPKTNTIAATIITGSSQDSHQLQDYRRETVNEDIGIAMLSLKQFSELDDCCTP